MICARLSQFSFLLPFQETGHRMITKKHKTMSLLWLTFCIIGNSINVHQLVSQYFRYQVSADVQFVMPDIIEVPCFVFCGTLKLMIKWSNTTREQRQILLRKRNRVSLNYDFDHESEQSVKNLTQVLRELAESKTIQEMILDDIRTNLIEGFPPGQQFSLTLDSSDFIADSMFFVNDYENKKLGIRLNQELIFMDSSRIRELHSSFFLVHSFMRDLRKCFSLQVREKFRIMNRRHLMRQRKDFGRIFSFKFGKNFTNSLRKTGFIPTPNHEPLAPGQKSGIVIPLTPTSFYLTYDTYRSKLLQYPFSTDCREYSEKGFVSLGDCIDSCIENKSLTLFRKLATRVSYFSNTTRIPMSPAEAKKTETKATLKGIMNHCDKKCSQRECHSVEYVPRVVSFTSRESGTVLNVATSMNPSVEVVCHASLSLVSMMTAVFSTFGFWMGMSVLGTRYYFKGFVSVTSFFLSPVQRKRHMRQKEIQRLRKSPLFVNVRKDGDSGNS